MYVLLRGAARLFERAGHAFMYLAAGTLRLQDLQRSIAKNWEDFGRSEDAILSGLLPWELALYDRFLKPEDRILVVGCGTGRDLIALLKHGYRAEGLDVNAGAVARARRMVEKEGLSAELYTGAVETVTLPGSFDVFIFSWFCYGYIPQADNRIGVLRKVTAHLTPGGRILISYVPGERPLRLLPIRLARFMARLTRSEWHPEPGDVIEPSAGDWQAIHYEHRFWEDELENEARAAGLRVVHHDRRDVGTAVLMR
jgi:SAM-dependent methyltransferase